MSRRGGKKGVHDFERRVNVYLLVQCLSPIVASPNEEENGYEKQNEGDPAYNPTNDRLAVNGVQRTGRPYVRR